MWNENINFDLALKHIYYVLALIMHVDLLISLINLELCSSHNPWDK